MNYKEALCTQIELYFHDITDNYHVTTVAAMQDAKKLRLFRKIDFTGHIAEFEKYKQKALKLESMKIDIPEDDKESIRLSKAFRNSLLSFVILCDANIAFYDQNQRKQYRDGGITVKGYTAVVNEMQEALREAVVDLDVLEQIYKEYSGKPPADQ